MAQGAEGAASAQLLLSLSEHTLADTNGGGREPPFPLVFASDKAVISDLTFPWEQTFTSLTVASLAGWGNSCDPDPAMTCSEPPSGSAN